MLANAFIGKTEKPSRQELETEIGSTHVLWDRLVQDLKQNEGVDIQEWRSYSPKAGWSFRLTRKKRNILYMIPVHGHFLVAFIFGQKAIDATRTSDVPASVMKLIDESPRYPEGTGFRIEVKKEKDLALVEKLAKIKLQH